MHRNSQLLLLPFLAFAGTSAVATEADQAAIGQGCLAKLNWSEPACQCLAEKAAEMEDVQQAFLAATLNQDSAAIADLRSKMTIPQITQASLFLVNAGPGCQGAQ